MCVYMYVYLNRRAVRTEHLALHHDGVEVAEAEKNALGLGVRLVDVLFVQVWGVWACVCFWGVQMGSFRQGVMTGWSNSSCSLDQ